MTANKGAVALRFNFDDTSFMFMNCHLTSGQNKAKERFADTRQAYAGATSFFDLHETQAMLPGIHDSFKRTQQDYQFIFGDTNFRCDLTNEQAKEMALRNDIYSLVMAD